MQVGGGTSSRNIGPIHQDTHPHPSSAGLQRPHVTIKEHDRPMIATPRKFKKKVPSIPMIRDTFPYGVSGMLESSEYACLGMLSMQGV